MPESLQFGVYADDPTSPGAWDGKPAEIRISNRKCLSIGAAKEPPARDDRHAHDIQRSPSFAAFLLEVAASEPAVGSSERRNAGSKLEMAVLEPRALGMRGGEYNSALSFMDELLAACNLCLRHARLSRDVTGANVQLLKDHCGPDGHAECCKGNGECGAEADMLDECVACDVLRMVHAVREMDGAKARSVQDALVAYSNGITSRDSCTVLRMLFTALERAVCLDGDSGSFGPKACELLGDPDFPASKMREAAHCLRCDGPAESLSGEEVSGRIGILRPAAAKAILARMRELAD